MLPTALTAHAPAISSHCAGQGVVAKQLTIMAPPSMSNKANGTPINGILKNKKKKILLNAFDMSSEPILQTVR